MSEDLRIRKTKNIIKETFIQMVNELGYQNITVKNLCEKALINRNTFYLHYSDKDDLVKTLMKESIDYLKINLQGSSFMGTIQITDYDLFQTEVKKIVQAINKDIELYRAILVDEYLSGYFKMLEISFENYVINQLNFKTKKEIITIKYIIYGIIGILGDWIVNDTASVDETAVVLSKLIYTNIEQFFY